VGVDSTVPSLVRAAAAEHGDRDWVVTPAGRLTFAEAEQRSALLAKRLLAAGLGKSRRVGLLFPQGPDFAVAFLAVTRIGAVAIPLSTFYRAAELRTAVRHADVDTLLTAAPVDGWPADGVLHVDDVPNLRRVWVDPLAGLADDTALSDGYLGAVEAEVTPADPLVVVSTSGSTAAPKAVVHSHGAQLREALHVARRYELDETTRTFTNMPFFWVGGLTVSLLAHLHVGGAVLTVERMDSGVMLDLAEAERPTRLLGWTLLERLQADATFAERDLVDRHLYEQPGPRHGSLGMTETGGPHTGAFASDNQVDLPPDLLGSFGPPYPEIEHRIADDGEIWVRGRNLMLGLHRRERHETFDEDGWYHTGDRGFLRDGLLFFTGRLTEMIKTGGANVAPREVELAVQELPGVQAAFVVGLPDDDRGEIVGCLVGAAPGQDPDPDELLTALRERLSSYKVPRRMIVVPYADLPFQAQGKLSRARITELLGG
jgi:acyl-CoA synthetase (AMP-forming)/AMP-acid ligase II